MSATAVATGSGSGWALPRFMTAEHPLPWLLPITAMLTVFGLYPLGYSIWLSLHKRNVLTRQLDFAGGYQWMRAFADQRMWGALETTLIYTLVALAVQLVLGLLIALLLDTDRRGYGVLRALMTLPLVVPPAVTGMMFLLMLDGSFGVLSLVSTRSVWSRRRARSWPSRTRRCWPSCWPTSGSGHRSWC